MLCLQEVLDTYGAWKVVVARHPKLPEGSGACAWWLLQLANGAQDARSHPEQYQALVGLLWGALGDASATARAAAATALSQHPPALLEELCAAGPLAGAGKVSPALCCNPVHSGLNPAQGAASARIAARMVLFRIAWLPVCERQSCTCASLCEQRF
jgi:hypothetical protein